MSKVKKVEELYKQTLKDIADTNNWRDFLKTAAQNYKYSFSEQSLIYAQKPNATACAAIDVWNRRLHRYVNRGTKGIALLHGNPESYKLSYVFDVSDTNGSTSKEIKLWNYDEKYNAKVINFLESEYGELPVDVDITDAITCTAHYAVEENASEYLRKLHYLKEGSFLEDMDEFNIDERFQTLAESSVTYQVMERLGLEPDNIFDAEFQDISDFNTFDTICVLGDAVSEISEEILSNIKNHEMLLKKLENNNLKSYNKNNNEAVNKEERDDTYGSRTGISSGGRLFGTGFRSSGATEETDREVRQDEGEIPQGTQEVRLFAYADESTTPGASVGDRYESGGKNEAVDKADGENRRRNGRTERERPDEVGRNDEQYKKSGGRNSSAGDSVQLSIFDSVDNRNDIIHKAEQLQSSAFSISQQIINEVNERSELIKQEKTNLSLPERHNFTITDNELGYGTASKKYAANVAAIRTLKQVEADSRLSTPEEQETLSRYVGWGSLADCFEEKHSKYNELKSLLTDEEFNSARESTLTAFYTPPVVIRSIYNALSNMGFESGNILDPAMGVGNFEGMLPESMRDSKVYGVELDSISGRIARQLYQTANVQIQGFEESELPDNFFDVAVGNVPFGNFKVMDKKYDKHNFLIHDYFFAKTLDKVRPNGIIAFITSSGTMDKKNSAVRKYIAQRAELLGAVRLPDNTFKANAGTEITSDIIFLKKRERMIDIEPDWVHLGTDANGHSINQYFIDNPEMILGEMVEESGQFGSKLACKAFKDKELGESLDKAITNIHEVYREYEVEDILDEKSNESSERISIPADPNVRNFSYTVYDGDIYFRENSVMTKVEASERTMERIKGMINIRDCVRELIYYQLENYEDEYIKAGQSKLDAVYDEFVKKNGRINSRGNASAFSADSSYFLLCSLEVTDENGEFTRKADIFTKRTVRANTVITKVDIASEALAVSLNEKAGIDMSYMSSLTDKTERELFEDLNGVIFLNPLYSENDGNGHYSKYLTADEYLSGNVREKLKIAQLRAETDERFKVNAEALKAAQPKDLTAAEISVRLGATWIPPEDIQRFIIEFLKPPSWAVNDIKVQYAPLTGNWNVAGKNLDNGINSIQTYGTGRINAYKIIEETLNLKDVKIHDYVDNGDGVYKPVLNRKETTVAHEKQKAIKAAFEEWLWKDPERRERLTKLYNEKFNSIRPREYDGSHITFNGMNPEIELRQHQKNAAARIIYGGNSLLAHVVGAGKTWTMVAAAMESKRLGLCNKPLFVVPNHLTEQWAVEFLQLYPSANILVASKKDFETKNRKKFCGRIATGEYDAVIIGHSQFEKIPMSVGRQKEALRSQIDEITDGIADLKASRAENFSIKQMESFKKKIELKLKKLNDQSRKDDVVTFEELGVDRIFVDEAHYYKNMYMHTKMHNVGGIPQSEAQKSSDLFMKCRYLDEITDGKGVIFATGTPISNSMVEMYTMQRYLQYDVLEKSGLQNFDSWASTFGETVTAIELAPEGTGYRSKTRFAKFFNLPELMNMFKNIADIQTSDMLNLPVPNAEYITVKSKPSEFQKKIVDSLAKRAEKVRNRVVEPYVDNMLKITNDGRKLALDQRLINPVLPDYENSKVNICVDNVFKIWEDGSADKLTQIIFCDLSTPKADGTFSVYNDVRDKLMKRGIPEDEIAFIHDANTEVKKKELFAKMRSGEKRILIGSTSKCGAGTNVQDRLIAIHDLDCPWRPSDLEQRAGRIVRQGNMNENVKIYRYVTEQTFDAYLYQLIENKQKFISQIMTSKSPVRSAEDIDEAVLSYAEIKAIAAGNPLIKEKMNLDIEVAKLRMLRSNYLNQKYSLENAIVKEFPEKIAVLKEKISGFESDMQSVSANKKFVIDICGTVYNDKESAGKAILIQCSKVDGKKDLDIGEYRGFKLTLKYKYLDNKHILQLKRKMTYEVELGDSAIGNISRIDNAIGNIEKFLHNARDMYDDTLKQFENAKEEVKKPFEQENELSEKTARLEELGRILNADKIESENEIKNNENYDDLEAEL